MPELNLYVLRAFILLFEIMFTNATILKLLLIVGGVTKNLQLNLELIALGEYKISQLVRAFETTGLGESYNHQAKDFVQKCDVFYKLVKVLTLSELNNLRTTCGGLSNKVTKKQTDYENYILGCTVNQLLSNKEHNKLGLNYDALPRLVMSRLGFKLLEETKKYAERGQVEVLRGSISDSHILNLTIEDIMKHYRQTPVGDFSLLQNDMIKVDIQAAAGLDK